MTLADILDPARIVVVDRPLPDRDAVLRLVAGLLAGPAPDPPGVTAAAVLDLLLEREQLASTAVGDGIAFPHAKVSGLEVGRAAVAVLPAPGVEMSAADGRPVRVVVAVIVSPDSVGEHLKMLGAFSRKLRAAPLRDALTAAPDAAAVLRLVGDLDVIPR